MKIKGITSGTYLLKRIKDKNTKLSSKEICNRCKFKDTCKYRNISKFENGKVFDNNVECEYFYFIITPKAILTVGRDTTTGKVMTKTFVGKDETEAFNKALTEKLKLDQNGGIKIITKSNKTIVDLVEGVLKEDYKLGKIKQATFKRKTDTLKKLQKEKFTNMPITNNYRNENWKALVLDYEKDIDLTNGKIYIRKTQTKNISGKVIIGETAKTENGERTLTMTNISKQIIESALEHKITNKNHLLFCKEDKTMHIENSINSNLKRIATKLGIGIYEEENNKGQLVQKTDVHTHMLRGTFATRCAETKIAPAVLKKILGHSDITITMQYYVDVDSEFESSENKNVENYLIVKAIFGVDFSTEDKSA